MKVLIAIAGVLVVGAVAVGVFAWSASGSEARCDDGALAEAMRESISAAEASGVTQTTFDAPSGCHVDDFEAAIPGVSRSWHAMPGGILMHDDAHEGGHE